MTHNKHGESATSEKKIASISGDFKNVMFNTDDNNTRMVMQQTIQLLKQIEFSITCLISCKIHLKKMQIHI